MKILVYDRYNATVFRNNFIHNESRVSAKRVMFHAPATIVPSFSGKSLYYGADVRQDCLSPFGYIMDKVTGYVRKG